MKKLLVSFIILFAGLLLVTQTAPLTSAAEVQPSVVATPTKVKQLNLDNATETTLKVSWQKHTADGTQIRVMTETGELVLKKNTKKRTSTTITGLTAGTTYTIKARGYNFRKDGEKKYGKYSTTVTAETDAAPVEDTEEEEENIPETFDVAISGFAFSPESLEVQVGDTVRWTNNDGTTHTVTSTDGNDVFNSGNLSNGETFEFTFTEVGDFDYFCFFHNHMTGTITVTE